MLTIVCFCIAHHFNQFQLDCFDLVYTIGLIYNAMSKSKSTVPSMVSCSFVYHDMGICLAWAVRLKFFFRFTKPICS